MKENRKIWVYDIETLKSCFTYTAINIDTEEIVKFVIHKDRNDSVALLEHLNNCKGQIGFNNINFDYPIIHFFMKMFETLSLDKDPEFTIQVLYQKAQDIITAQNQINFTTIVAIAQNEWLIAQLDLFKLWHFNNKARSTSLKSLQIAMNYPNVMEMPISHTRDDIREDEIEGILEYNLNDVLSTFEFYKKSIDKIELRRKLNEKYNLQCLNFADTKIGEQLTLKMYCEATNKNPWDVKKLRTEHESINIGECIFDYIKFNSKEFNNLLNKFKSSTIKNTKGELENSVIYKGFKYDFGSGGIHGCIAAGLYESDDRYIIIDADVASLYPSIAIVNKLYPKHLGIEFCDVYENGIVKPRLEAKKRGDSVMADGFKLSANSVYGKSNDKYSFLMDAVYTMKTTINGQLMLAMLAERLVDNIDDIIVLQINTDGITVKIDKKFVPIYNEICRQWQEDTNLVLEYAEYKKMWIRDVNNYGALSMNGKIKNKGAFEIDKDYHKDNSFKIIPIAIQNYFVNGVPIEDTILGCTNIYDFCGRQKFKSGESYGTIHYLKGDEIVQEIQQKNVRYYISNKGATFIKNYNKGTNEVINKGYQVTIFNKFVEKNWLEYNINYDFYIKEANKEIDNIINKQYKLEF